MFAKLVTVADRFLDITLSFAGSIPFDESLRRAVQKQRSVVETYPNAKSSLAFAELAEEVDGWPVSANPSGHLEFFVERLVGSNRVG
jgi:flagellar biosynthesis protein FlhG